MKKNLLLILATIILSGCAAALVPYTSDPSEKLEWAYYLLEKGRALPAEKLIIEAVEICQENNSSLCLGEAYKTYCYFYRSSAVRRYEKRYIERGFYDKNVTYEDRYNQSKIYCKKSITEFSKINRYDLVTNAYVMLGYTYAYIDTKLECGAYDTSVIYNEKFSKENPTAKISLPKGYTTYKEYINAEKKLSKCSDKNITKQSSQ